MRYIMMLGVIIAGLSAEVTAQEVTLAAATPVVVKTVPESGADGVDASTTELKVTFSKKMMSQTWSWAMVSQNSFPKVPAGHAPRYEADGKTAVLPVTLEKGKTYAIWINTRELGNFKDTDGRSAVPYLLIFQTAP